MDQKSKLFKWFLLLVLIASLNLTQMTAVSAANDAMGESPAASVQGTAVTTAIAPDKTWVDTNGNPIDAHGPGIMYDEKTQKYYWYGEYHNGSWPSGGVRVYSSTDLLNWTDEGMALTLVHDFGNMGSVKTEGACPHISNCTFLPSAGCNRRSNPLCVSPTVPPIQNWIAY